MKTKGFKFNVSIINKDYYRYPYGQLKKDIIEKESKEFKRIIEKGLNDVSIKHTQE